MARRPKVAGTVAALRRSVARWRDAGETVALVPTMGALHEGHLSLVRLARRRADRVVVSIFVNPAQFAPNEDFSTYPRTFAADLAVLAEEQADLVWAPQSVGVMYPDGFATRIVPEGPAAAGLEDAFRPDFFKGVATVVAKLFTAGRARHRGVRREGLPAAQGRHPHGARSRPAAASHRRADRARDTTASRCRRATSTSRPDERAAAPVLHRVLTLCAAEDRQGPADRDDPQRGPRGDRARRVCARLSRSAPRRDAGADPLGQGRPGAAAGGGEARQDAADRQCRGVAAARWRWSCAFPSQNWRQPSALPRRGSRPGYEG